jgi:hypothetical protein
MNHLTVIVKTGYAITSLRANPPQSPFHKGGGIASSSRLVKHVPPFEERGERGDFSGYSGA